MADAQAPTAPSATAVFGTVVSACEYLTLRAFGRNGNVVVYHVFDGKQNQRVIPHRIICIIEVVEATQDIQVKLNGNGCVLLTAKYGIRAMQDKMSIFLPNLNMPFAELNNVQAIDYINQCNGLSFKYAHDFPKGVCIVQSAGQGQYRFVAVANLQQRMHTCIAQFFGNNVSNIQKVLTMMTMLKLYYTAYLLQFAVKPASIPGRMPAVPRLIPTVQYLAPMSNIIMRVACLTPTGWSIDVLDAATNKIILIIEYMLVDKKLLFRDPAGTMHFTSQVEGNTNSVQTDTGKPIGSFCYNSTSAITQFFDIQTGTPIMTEQPSSQQPHGHRQVTSASYNQAVVAEYITLVRRILLIVTMEQTIPVEHKALILASASYKAIAFYYIVTGPVPDMDAYPFRPSLI